MRSRALALALCALSACAAPGGRTWRATPDLTARPLVGETLAGQPVLLSGPGPVRLVELWATWCTPCAPAGERARAVLARHPRVTAYALSLDQDRAALAARVAAAPPPGTPLVFPGGPAAAARRGLSELPMFIVLDAHGRVVGTTTGLWPGLGPALERLLRMAEGTGETLW